VLNTKCLTLSRPG